MIKKIKLNKTKSKLVKHHESYYFLVPKALISAGVLDTTKGYNVVVELV